MLQEHPQGVVLLVRAQPGSRKEGIVGTHAGRLKVAVHAAPENGKANAALVRVLANALGIKKKHITLISGETSGNKAFLLASVEIDEVQGKIAGWLA